MLWDLFKFLSNIVIAIWFYSVHVIQHAILHWGHLALLYGPSKQAHVFWKDESLDIQPFYFHSDTDKSLSSTNANNDPKLFYTP